MFSPYGLRTGNVYRIIGHNKSQVMFSQPMSEVFVVFQKSTICAFTKKNFLVQKQEKMSFIQKGRKSQFCLLLWYNSTRSYSFYYYYYHTTYLLLLLPLQIYNLLLMASWKSQFWVQLSRYNSKSINCYRKHPILPLLLKTATPYY